MKYSSCAMSLKRQRETEGDIFPFFVNLFLDCLHDRQAPAVVHFGFAFLSFKAQFSRISEYLALSTFHSHAEQQRVQRGVNSHSRDCGIERNIKCHLTTSERREKFVLFPENVLLMPFCVIRTPEEALHLLPSSDACYVSPRESPAVVDLLKLQISLIVCITCRFNPAVVVRGENLTFLSRLDK